jgi:ribosome biogenesis SPOUT family RNA methylase Rps3
MGLPVRMIYASATATISVAAIERAVTIDISVKPSLSLSLKLQVVLEVRQHHSMSPEECTNFEVVCFGL